MNKANEQSTILLKKYLENSISNNKSNFFILSGPKGIGKSGIAINLAKEILGNYFINDFLHIKDFSDSLGKEHILTIEYKDTNKGSKEILDTFNYIDLGTREINDRLAVSPTGIKKIVLIENIERMNRPAINAFLKNCEEPLPNRIIIATTSNKSRVLSTILSRAILIPFFEYSYEDSINYCNEKKYFLGEEDLKNLICKMSMGKIGIIDLFHEKLCGEGEFIDKEQKINREKFKNQFKNIIKILQDSPVGVQSNILNNINKIGLVNPFINGLIAYYILENQFNNAENRINIKKNLRTNVKVENLLFSAII